MNVFEGSRAAGLAGRLIQGSVLAGWWLWPPSSIQAAPNAWCLKTLHAHTGVLQALGLTGVVLLMLALPLYPACAAAVLLAAAYPILGVALLPAALLWSPRIEVFGWSGENVFVRLDQCLVLGLLLHAALTKRLLPRDTPLLAWQALFLCACAASVTAGLLQDTLPSVGLAGLYLGQLLHLAILFAAAYAFAPRLGRWGVYAFVLPIIAAGAYGLAEQHNPYMHAETFAYRTFERGWFDGQANHFAGVFVLASAMGLALAALPRWRALGIATVVLSILGLAGTHSREGVVALGAALACLALIRWPRLWLLAALAALAAAIHVSGEPWHRASMPGGSLFDRLLAWKAGLSTLGQFPLLGLGLGARHRSYYDNQYVFLLAECGAMGLAAFAAWWACLGRALRHGAAWDSLRGVLCAGALAGLGGMAVQGMAASCCIITVIAGPLYWLSGYALGLEEENENFRPRNT